MEQKDLETAHDLIEKVLDETLTMTMNEVDLQPAYLKALFVYQRNLTSETKSLFDFIPDTKSENIQSEMREADFEESSDDDFIFV